MKEVENVVDTRSQDIRGAIAQLHSTVMRIQLSRPPCILFLGTVAIDDAPGLLPGNFRSFRPADVRQRCVEPVGPFSC